MTSSYTSSMTTLSYIFFFIAGVWLIAALLYSLLVLCFLRLRATGELGNMDDEEFGRVPIFGNSGLYVPLGCIFRRYARHLQLEEMGLPRNSGHFMSKRERRAALESLLMNNNKTENATMAQKILMKMSRKQHTGETTAEKDVESTPDEHDAESVASENVPMCSICLCEYNDDEKVFVPTTCSHQFHHECILDWLQLPGRTECPCCRVAMVNDDQVWKAVKRLRQDRKATLKKQQSMASNNVYEEGEPSETEEMDESSSSVDYGAADGVVNV